jgi:hypothetical protein
MCLCASIAFSICHGCAVRSLTATVATMVVPGIDPELAVRRMLAGLSGIVHDRKLMREAHVNNAIRWFAGYALHEKLPDIRA